MVYYRNRVFKQAERLARVTVFTCFVIQPQGDRGRRPPDVFPRPPP